MIITLRRSIIPNIRGVAYRKYLSRTMQIHDQTHEHGVYNHDTWEIIRSHLYGTGTWPPF